MSANDALSERLGFIDLDAEAQERLRSVKPIVMGQLSAALDAFYQRVQATPATRGFFSNPSHMAAAKSRQVEHWERISSGQFDPAYVRAVTAVGEAHARIGLQPRWYIGGYALLLEAMIEAVVAARWPKGAFSANKAGAKQVAGELSALAKASLLDMDYAISVYLEAAERARQAVEQERAAKAAEQAQVVCALAGALERVAQGDLTGRLDQAFPEDYERLRADFNHAIARLEETIAQVAVGASGVSAGSDEIARASDDLARRTEQQAASLEETAAALDQITATVKTTAANAKQASDVVTATMGEAEHSGAVVAQAVEAMSQIEGSSQQIGQIIGVIDEIAFQTNLLALNAGVEAARAGDAGRGFAVVAQEVRALAQRSADAAKEIKALISASTQQVGQGVSLVGETGKTLSSILARVGELEALVAQIAISAQEQATGLSEVNIAVNQMDQVVQQNAAMVETSTASTHALKGETDELAGLIARFRVTTVHAPARLAASPPRPAPRRTARSAA